MSNPTQSALDRLLSDLRTSEAARERAEKSNRYYENALYFPGIQSYAVQDGNDAVEISPQRVADIIARAEQLQQALDELRPDAERWREIRKKIRPYMEFEGKPVMYINGHTIGFGRTPEEAMDDTLRALSSAKPKEGK